MLRIQAMKSKMSSLTWWAVLSKKRLCKRYEKISSRVYVAAVISSKHGAVQRLLQEREGREIPHVHCLNRQLHLMVVHALSEEQAVQGFFEVCNGLYNYFRKPTIAAQYNGGKLKWLLGQRWTGHLATTSTVFNSFQDIVALLNQISSTRNNGVDIRMQATGLLR